MKKNQGDDATDRQHHGECYRKARNKYALVCAADRAQGNQAIGENAGEHSEHDLRDMVPRKVPQDT